MSEEMKIGDVVQLKSGGPLMTVSRIGDSSGVLTVWCKWFDGAKECNGAFSAETVAVDRD